MILQIHKPSYPLDQFIDSFLYYSDYRPEHMLDRLLPDGNITLLIELTGTPQHVYDNETLAEIQTCRDVWFSGIRDTFLTIPSCRDIAMFVINFRKGMAAPFLEGPVNIYTNHVVDGALACAPHILELREKLLENSNFAAQCAIAENHLYQFAKSRLHINPCVSYAIEQMLIAPAQQTLSGIVDKVGYSHKHFIRMFRQHVGLTPKMFMRIARFQRVLHETVQFKTLRWTDIALDCGYYDQAHFIHDFKNFSGLTPQSYLEKESRDLNYIPIA